MSDQVWNQKAQKLSGDRAIAYQIVMNDADESGPSADKSINGPASGDYRMRVGLPPVMPRHFDQAQPVDSIQPQGQGLVIMCPPVTPSPIIPVPGSSYGSLTSNSELGICNKNSSCCGNHTFRLTFQTLVLGQLMSLCLCGTAISSQMLANSKFNAPTAQASASYFFLALFYGVVLLFRNDENKNFGTVIRNRGWKYLILALIDVEANFLIVYAYQFTNLTSIQLLDCFTIPVVMFLSWAFLSVRYLKSHWAGVGICLIGISMIITADAMNGKGQEGGSNRILGDLLCLSATVFYGIANVSEEFLVKQNDRTEYLGLVGFFGFIISTVQFTVLESTELFSFKWSPTTMFYYLLFTASMFMFYSIVSLVMQRSSALMFNLSVLTADFYALIAGVYLFGYSFDFLYLASFLVVISGSTLYSFKKTKEKGPGETNTIMTKFCECCCPLLPICFENCRNHYRSSSTSYEVKEAQIARDSVFELELHPGINGSSYTSNSSFA